MIKGLLLYKEDDAKINKWFINHLTEVSKNKGIQLSFSDFTQDFFTQNTEYFKQFDFCINRTRCGSINAFLEKNNIRCYNNLKTVTVANDKWSTYLLCKELGIPVTETVKLSDSVGTELDYPFIIKSRNGHGGSEVFWVNSEQELQQLSLTNKNGYIAQRVVSDLGIDVRVYVLGKKCIAGVKRTSSVDFRSNYSLGGKVELFTPVKEQLEIIDKLQGSLAADYVGFDFILHNGKWLLNEIEDAVGARMLYSLCDYDVGEEFIKYIYEEINN